MLVRGYTPVAAAARQAARRRSAAARRSSQRRSRVLLAPARLASAVAAARHSAAARRGGLRLLRCKQRVSCAVLLYAATRLWPLRLDRPSAVEAQLLAAHRGDACARCLRPLGWPPRLRMLDTRPPLDAAACASCAVSGASLAPCFSTRPHARGRCGSTGHPPSRRSCSPLIAATLAHAACARSVGRRGCGCSTLGRRSTRRLAPPAL